MNLRKSLDEFYCCAALRDLRIINKKFVNLNITHNELLYLELVYNLERMGKPCTASHIAELLYLSKPPVRAAVNDLIRKGLLTKKLDPLDNRQYPLSVNEEAVPDYCFCHRHNEPIVDRITQQFSPEDIEKFCQMLDLLAKASLADLDS